MVADLLYDDRTRAREAKKKKMKPVDRALAWALKISLKVGLWTTIGLISLVMIAVGTALLTYTEQGRSVIIEDRVIVSETITLSDGTQIVHHRMKILKKEHKGLPLRQSSFMATSAYTLTGLAEVAVSQLSGAGQAVLWAGFLQSGLGMGVIFTLISLSLAGTRDLYKSKTPMAGLLGNLVASDPGILRRIVVWVLAVQVVSILFGTMTMVAGIATDSSIDLQGNGLLWTGLFYNTSAHEHTGFGLLDDNCIRFAGNLVVIWTLNIQMMIGQLGYAVHARILANLLALVAPSRFAKKINWLRSVQAGTSHFNVVLWATLLLVGGGTAFFVWNEWSNPQFQAWKAEGEMRYLFLMISNGVFASISARTAGLNSVMMVNLGLGTLATIVVQMGIGGAPGSPTGGMKVTNVWHLFSWKVAAVEPFGSPVNTFWARLKPTTIKNGLIAPLCFGMVVTVGTFLIVVFDQEVLGLGIPHFGVAEVIFEVISALCNVGYSTPPPECTTSLSTYLSPASSAVLQVLMFIGKQSMVGSVLGIAELLILFRIAFRWPYNSHRGLPEEEVAPA